MSVTRLSCLQTSKTKEEKRFEDFTCFEGCQWPFNPISFGIMNSSNSLWLNNEMSFMCSHMKERLMFHAFKCYKLINDKLFMIHIFMLESFIIKDVFMKTSNKSFDYKHFSISCSQNFIAQVYFCYVTSTSMLKVFPMKMQTGLDILCKDKEFVLLKLTDLELRSESEKRPQ